MPLCKYCHHEAESNPEEEREPYPIEPTMEPGETCSRCGHYRERRPRSVGRVEIGPEDLPDSEGSSSLGGSEWAHDPDLTPPLGVIILGAIIWSLLGAVVAAIIILALL